MTRRVKVLGSWGPRAESREECGERIHEMLSGLAEVHSTFQGWCSDRHGVPGQDYQVGQAIDDRIELLEPFHTTEEWGWSGGAHIPDEEDEDKMCCTFRTECGGHKFDTDENQIRLDLGVYEQVAERGLLKPGLAVEILKVLVEAWDPECADFDVGISVANVLEDIRRDTAPMLGWLTFLSHSSEELPELPEDVAVESIASGVVIRVGDEPPDPHDEAEMEHHRAIYRRLKEAGVVEPIVPI